ncbi:class I SAM-dependent methyltransferase [Dellaglioa carnosa]|uniref:class I SAM-dependent methyltransferase n=1 Tax=Dellaglioa carnosa TaxID=2995136 RepID=UPI0022A87ED4|nr:class I SAM-dependent methyltransferase [Dellaglioa carnosa]MCZ2492743.1 class I SAM-dependent methyltransferase [Dellaglioa carnosa]
MIYTTFSKLYDQLMDPDLYDSWQTFVEAQVPNKKTEILELACGAGQLAIALTRSGYSVVGLDLSEEMLSIADQHAQDANVSLPLLQGDMMDLEDLELPQFDAVTCFADSFCYLPDAQSVGKVFKSIHGLLRTDGRFVFDVISTYQTDDVYPGYMYNYQDNSQAFLWSTFQDEQPHSVVHELTFFVKNESNDQFEKITEDHHERTYSVETYTELLKNAGFKNIQVSADFGTSKIDDKTTRLFFVCDK